MKVTDKILLLFLIMGSLSLSAHGRWNNTGNFDPAENATPDTLIPGNIVIDTFDLNILPPSSGVRFYEDGIIYLSSSKASSRMLPQHVSFGNTVAMFSVIKDLKLNNSRVFSPGTDFIWPCDAVTFTKDFKTMYFTRSGKKEEGEKIFKATLSSGEDAKGKWNYDEKPLPFCSGTSIYTHPALSPDGKLMIFASNRPGTRGGMDLWVTQFEGGIWTDPKNLGEAINSASDEMYPYIDNENNLFFSSDGHPGFGGYDIFVCSFRVNTWDAPVNLSIPVNTVFDDVAFTIDNRVGKSAFYTIKEKSGKRSVKLIKVSLGGTGRTDEMKTLSQFFTNPAARNVVMIVTEPAVEATDRRAERAPVSRGREDKIVYRVQFLTSFNPNTRPLINVEGVDYSIYEYLYSGAYRLCIGEFSSISPAIELRNKLLKSDFPQATVVVFRNNIRSFDQELLTENVVQDTTKPALKPETIKSETPVSQPVQLKEEIKKPEPAPQTTKQPETRIAEPLKAVTNEPPVKEDVVTYRVQILSNKTSRGSYEIKLSDKSYKTFEYNYAGSYRICIGEFSTLSPAVELQKICRKDIYPQAFVVAFKNNVRSTDPALFK